MPIFISSEIKHNKGSILKASVDYIRTLQNELNKTRDMNEKFRQMTFKNSLINKKLLMRLKVRKLLIELNSEQLLTLYMLVL